MEARTGYLNLEHFLPTLGTETGIEERERASEREDIWWWVRVGSRASEYRSSGLSLESPYTYSHVCPSLGGFERKAFHVCFVLTSTVLCCPSYRLISETKLTVFLDTVIAGFVVLGMCTVHAPPWVSRRILRWTEIAEVFMCFGWRYSCIVEFSKAFEISRRLIAWCLGTRQKDIFQSVEWSWSSLTCHRHWAWQLFLEGFTFRVSYELNEQIFCQLRVRIMLSTKSAFNWSAGQG